MRPDLHAQFAEREIRLPPNELPHAEVAIARWNSFCDGRKRGLQVATERRDRQDGALLPPAAVLLIGTGALLGHIFASAALSGGTALVITGTAWFTRAMIHGRQTQWRKP